jgi:hypothetical protein
MNPQFCRSFLSGWRTRMFTAATLGTMSLTGAAKAQDRREIALREAPSPSHTAIVTTPQNAAKLIRAGEKVPSTARMQAVILLGATAWQSDQEAEGILIYALRADPSESVRAQAGAVFAKSAYLAPKSFEALQCCAVGSGRDGFPGERALAVKWQANEALKKHSTSGNPQQIAILQQAKTNFKGVRLEGPAGGIVRGGAEESSPPEPLNVPPPTPKAAAPASPPVVKTVAAGQAPTPLERTTPDAKDQALKLPEYDSKISLRQRREELRELGLQDPTIKLFTQQASAPPPKTAASNSWFRSPASGDSPGLWKGIFPTVPANEPETARAAPGTFVSRPNPRPEPEEGPKPGAWNRLFARFAPSTEATEPVAQAPNASPGFLSRLLPNWGPTPTNPEIVPVSTNPPQR